ncbi:hypothetical protein ACQGAO_32605 [Rhodococcus sp. 1.20]
MSNGPVLVRSSITGFVQRNPDALGAFGSSAAQTGGGGLSRRTWSMLAAVLPHLREGGQRGDQHGGVRVDR